MVIKLGINNTNLTKAFIALDKRNFADFKDREKKKQNKKAIKKKMNKVSYTTVFEDFHSLDLIG